MADSLHLQTKIIGPSAQQVFEAWMDSRIHAAFTGDPAEIDPEVGGSFTISGGYITRRNLELEPIIVLYKPGAQPNFRIRRRIRGWKFCWKMLRMAAV
jgi:hypothetical protein